jgi:hypothetical protein
MAVRGTLRLLDAGYPEPAGRHFGFSGATS